VPELQKIVLAAKAMPGDIGGVPARIFWPALILTCYQSAERIGAIMSLEKSDYSRPRVFVRAEVRKAGKRDKWYKFSDSLCDLLDILADSNKKDPKLFVWKGPPTYLWGRFGAIVRAAGLSCGRRDKFHKLRRSAATHYASLGHDATALLDHSSPKITKRFYLDVTQLKTGPDPSEVLPDIE
jgi:integrase